MWKIVTYDNTYCMSQSSNSQLAVPASMVLSKEDITITMPMMSIEQNEMKTLHIL